MARTRLPTLRSPTPELAQVHVHIAEHGIEHRLRQGGPGLGQSAQAMDQQEGVAATTRSNRPSSVSGTPSDS